MSDTGQFARLGRLAREVLELRAETDDQVDHWALAVATMQLEHAFDTVLVILQAGGAR